MAKDPCEGVKCIVDDQVLKKDVLSQEEIQRLIDTHYPREKGNVRNAFIFCLYTGMRFCDVKDLRYGSIDYANRLLSFEQDKTKGHSARSWVSIPLNDGLLTLVGKPEDSGKGKEDLIFDLPTYESCCKSVRRWVKLCRHRQAYQLALCPPFLRCQHPQQWSQHQDRCQSARP